jgi:hypothetical protein
MVVAEFAVSIAERNFSQPYFLRVFLSALRKSTGQSRRYSHSHNTLRCVERGAIGCGAAQSETDGIAEESRKLSGGFTPHACLKIAGDRAPEDNAGRGQLPPTRPWLMPLNNVKLNGTTPYRPRVKIKLIASSTTRIARFGTTTTSESRNQISSAGQGR